MLTKILLVAAIACFAARADDSDTIRAALRAFNEAVKRAETSPLRVFFTADADYRDAGRLLRGPDALAALFAGRQAWSERTPPMIQEQSIRLSGSSAAFVDAQLVQYGSTIVKSGIPVVLLLEKDGDDWKIASFRMASCALPAW
jgi:ketosteroid isomerase-like protein